MNSFAPAYSAITLTITLLGLTLAGYPASVFAQTEATETTTSQNEVINATPNDSQPVSHKIEKLKGDAVYSDFVVGPGRFQLEIAPGESKTVEMVVTNRMGIAKTFSFSTEDMSGDTDPDRSVVLLGDEVGPYSIKDFISVPHETFVLEHAERARVPVTVAIPPDAEPGGFYGSLLTQIVSEDIKKDHGGEALPGSKIVSRIATLFFVTTPGEITRSLEVKDFSTTQNQKFFSKGPVTFNIVSENTGSVHVTPYGNLRILNTLGNEVGFVELQPWNVLPNSIRNKEIQWNREFLVGKYTAIATVNHGYDNVATEVRYSFWVMPLELVATTFGVLFVVFLILRFFFSRFEFKRKGN